MMMASLVLLAATALEASVGALPSSAYADTEASTNVPFRVDATRMTRLAFTLSVDASPSNCVEVAIGADADGNGDLSLDETDHAFGYDCGYWFHRDAVRDQVENQGGGGEGTAPVERTFVLWRRELSGTWNLMKVIRRGRADVGEIVFAEGSTPGTSVYVK